MYNDPIPSDEALSAFYSKDYRQSYKGAGKPRKRQIVRNFRRVCQHINASADILSDVRSVLDIGAGSGEFLFAMKFTGKQTRGIEPNREYAAYCRDDLGLNVQTDEVSPDMFDGEKFDYIRLNHVLEHVNNPVAKLSTIAGYLKDDGVLYVEVPNIEAYAGNKSKGRIFHYGHIFNFNAWTLRVAAGLAGLVEDEHTGDLAGVFLRKGSPWSREQAGNPDNAERVAKAIAAHYAGKLDVAKTTARPARKLMLRIEETMAGWRHGTPGQIGQAVLAKHLKLG